MFRSASWWHQARRRSFSTSPPDALDQEVPVDAQKTRKSRTVLAAMGVLGAPDDATHS